MRNVRVVDLSWIAAGPIATKYLAMFGAEVIRIESRERLDLTRTSSPFRGLPDPDRSGFFAHFNCSKQSVAISLQHQKAKPIIEQLVRCSDVLIENFSPGTIERLGLGYQALRRIKPDLIMVSTSAQGQTGPHASHPGVGLQLQALAGINHLTGWPDRSPLGTNEPYTDAIAPWFVLVAILSALDYRRRTGKGQYIDVSQYETALHFLAPALLFAAAADGDFARMGNASLNCSPHGVYRCKGNDAWCTIAVRSDTEWDRLCEAMGRSRWCLDPRFRTVTGRLSHREELDRLLESWTIKRSAQEVMGLLQSYNIPSGPVATGKDLSRDPQLKMRKHRVLRRHPQLGYHSYSKPSFRFSELQPLIKPAPLLGQHTERVCKQLLGMHDHQYDALVAEGAFR